MTYKLDFLEDLVLVHLVFHLSLFKMWISEPTSIISLYNVGVRDRKSYEVVPVDILDHQTYKDEE